ncbi:MAG: ABC transporter ATP-binding protein [Methylococcaceae bacterium]|nr:MAG: ABC transporter ATP-binding protein [Methylococcaceae bacterium]
MKSSAIITVENLNKWVSVTYGVLNILYDVSFSIARGESVAIMGASGSGKSTLLGLMAGLDEASSGTVSLDGTLLSDLDEDGRARLRARLLGFVFQSFQLLASLTAWENVMLPLELAGARNAAQRAAALLEQVGLAQRLHHYPRQLSGGEQQRVALARAFITRPPLLFADEPTGNLDVTTGLGVMDLLFELNRQQQTTLVLVTHEAPLAERCQRVLRLDAGRLVAD